MRIRRDGQRYSQDLNAQDFPHNPATPRQMLLTHMRQALGYLDWFEPKLSCSTRIEIITARAALRLLIEYLERNK